MGCSERGNPSLDDGYGYTGTYPYRDRENDKIGKIL